MVFSRVYAAAVLAAVIAAAGPAWAQPQPAEPQARIIVTGTGTVTAAPDYADVGCGVTTRARTAAEAADGNSKAMQAIAAALRNAGVADNDIQTSRFSLQPDYAPAQPNTAPKLIGFAVTNQFSVTIRQIDRTGDILDRLVAAGATDIGNVGLRHADTSKLLDQARTAAIADARRKAEIYAQAAGLTLGNVVWISEEDGRAMPFAPMMRAAAAPVPVAVGEDRLSAEVTVGFDVAR